MRCPSFPFDENVFLMNKKTQMNYDWISQARFASWWLTWEDLEWPDLGLESKWKRRAEILKSQGVNTVVVFGFHFRWDYIFIADRVLEILARISDICHDCGLRFVEHHSAVCVHRVRNVQDRWKIRRENHHHVPFYPDNWESLEIEGSKLADWRELSARTEEPVHVERYNCAVFCPNNLDFQKAYMRQIERLLERVHIDALMSDDVMFFDDTFTCSCRYCRDRFRNEAGLELPSPFNKDFWDNRENPDFQKWIQLRYKWTSEHHQRLRSFLPQSAALWACASDCLDAGLADLGFSPQHNVSYWDAVFHEVFHKLRIDSDNNVIRSELAAFASIARWQNKPLVVIFYINSHEELPQWLELLAEYNARPWVCKQVRAENAVPEEKLLSGILDYPDSPIKGSTKPVAGILFSQKHRDNLPVGMAEEYVKQYRVLCSKLTQQEYVVEVVFDQYMDKADALGFEQMWSLAPSLDTQTIEPKLNQLRCV
jgi:hypothetical protein